MTSTPDHPDRSTSLEELRRPGLPPTLPFETAFKALGMGRSSAYTRARSGDFPVTVIKLGPGKWVCPTAELLRLLGIESPAPAAAAQ